MTGAAALDDILARLDVLPPSVRKAVEDDVMQATASRPWVPNPGPQSDAFYCLADETFYGGQAGGGKTELSIGLALTEHKRSLLLRRFNDDARAMALRAVEILGHDKGLNRTTLEWALPGGRHIEFGGCQHEDDKQRYKGRPHDLIAFDEGADFTESQYEFITIWNRSTVPGQRCRVLVASNPPTTAAGLWIIKRWAAWLDPKHPNPAKPGEIRWYIRGADDREVEVDGPGPHDVDGREVRATSRTFIRSSLADNPDLSRTDYGDRLAMLPAELRQAYRDGRFDASLKDQEWQVIPTAWIVAAQERWKPDGFKGFAMTAMALDPAGGGRDSAELALRYGGWYGPLVSAQGPETADGSATAATVIKHRRDACPIVVDVGGGWGGSVIMRLKDNGLQAEKFDGASTHALGKTKDGTLTFVNNRARAWWRFREELDPDQEGGSAIALPPDPELLADLATPTWTLKARGIQLESKEDIRKRLGRSPGKGDAVVMALDAGNRAAQRKAGFGRPKPTVVMSHSNARRR